MDKINNKNDKTLTFEKVERNKRINLERLGETIMQNCGEIAFIVEYNSSTDVTVQFKPTGELVKCTYQQFKCGFVKSHFTPSVFGVGIVGLESSRDSKGNLLPSYQCWSSMIQRAYSVRFHEKQTTYKDVIVCTEWLYYSNFKSWYDENYYEINGKTSQLDKDFLSGENKIYSPNTCVFVPSNINSLITKSSSTRGKFPIGVCFHKASERYMARCCDGTGKSKTLGYFNNPENAFQIYKEYKEDLIKQLANEYKDQLPTKLYTAMLKYEVLITD